VQNGVVHGIIQLNLVCRVIFLLQNIFSKFPRSWTDEAQEQVGTYRNVCPPVHKIFFEFLKNSLSKD